MQLKRTYSNGPALLRAAVSMIVFIGAGCSATSSMEPVAHPADRSVVATSPSSVQTVSDSSVPNTATASSTRDLISPPLPDAVSRVTKKYFGTYVTPQHSPVSPERFTGYHTGIDFETTPEEQAKDVSVSAVCTGPLLMKEWAHGYGGVAVQKCTLAQQAVTVIYGHLRESSISSKVGATLTAGQAFAILGTGHSSETDDERKHLHLGIHAGPSINILGYVQQKSDLSQWLDPLEYLK